MSINALQKGATYAEFKAEAQETLNKLKTIWKPQVGVAQQPTVMEKLKASLRSTDNLFEMMDDWQYGFSANILAQLFEKQPIMKQEKF